jgi:hypothetical protein
MEKEHNEIESLETGLSNATSVLDGAKGARVNELKILAAAQESEFLALLATVHDELKKLGTAQ